MNYGVVGREDSRISSVDDPDLAAIKATLRNGDLISFSGNIFAYIFDTIPAGGGNDESLVGEKIVPKVEQGAGSHMLTIVGYNDNIWFDINGNGKVDEGEKGAFKIANSWGDDWYNGNKGFFWVAYDALNEQSTVEGVGYNPKRQPCMFDYTKLNVTQKSPSSNIFLKYTLNSDNRSDSYLEVTAQRKSDGTTYTRRTNPFSWSDFDGCSAHRLNYEGKTGFCDGEMLVDLNNIIPDLNTNNFHDYTWSVRFVDIGTDTAATTVKEAYMVDEATGSIYQLDAAFPFPLNKTEKTVALKDYYHFSKLYVPAASSLTVGSPLKFTFKTANETFGSTPIKYTITVTRGNKIVSSKQHKASSVDKTNHSSVIKATWTPSKAGTYTVTVTGTDASGTSTIRSATFTVYKPQLAVNAISIDKGKYIGQYEKIKITPQVTGGTAPYTYSYYYIKGGKTVKIAENTTNSTKTKQFGAKTGKYTLLVKVKDAKGTTAQATQCVVVGKTEITRLFWHNDHIKAGQSLDIRADVVNLADTIQPTELIYTVEKDGQTTVLPYRTNVYWPPRVSWTPKENGVYTITATIKYGNKVVAAKSRVYDVGDTLNAHKNIIHVNVISYLCTSANINNFYIHYWGGSSGAGDVKCVSSSKTMTKNIGYWDTAQTFWQYTADIPADATGYKFHIGDRWFSEGIATGDGSTASSNTVYAFNYNGDKAVYTME